MENQKRTAFVFSGGSGWGAVQVGVLFYLDRNNIPLDQCSYFGGTSVGAINLLPAITGRIEEGGRIWTNGCLHRRLFRWQRILSGKRPLNLGYLMQLLRTTCPIDMRALRDFHAPVEVTMTSCVTGKTRYVDLRKVVDPYYPTTVSASLPLVHGTMPWKGEQHMDGGMGNEIPLDRAFEHADHVIVVLTWPKTERATPPARWLTSLAFPLPWQRGDLIMCQLGKQGLRVKGLALMTACRQ